MTAYDHETGEQIISPYVLISKKRGSFGVFLNAGTFGTTCQEELIHPLDQEKLRKLDEETCYEVTAVVGEYNSPHIKTISVDRTSRSKTLMGYLELDVVKTHLPKTFEELKKN